MSLLHLKFQKRSTVKKRLQSPVANNPNFSPTSIEAVLTVFPLWDYNSSLDVLELSIALSVISLYDNSRRLRIEGRRRYHESPRRLHTLEHNYSTTVQDIPFQRLSRRAADRCVQDTNQLWSILKSLFYSCALHKDSDHHYPLHHRHQSHRHTRLQQLLLQGNENTKSKDIQVCISFFMQWMQGPSPSRSGFHAK